MTTPTCARQRHGAFALGTLVLTGCFGVTACVLAVAAVAVGVRYGSPWQAAMDWPHSARIKSAAISESSGLVASRRHPGVFWTHNDSGNSPAIFAIKADGTVLGRYRIKGAKNVDWEDIAIDDAGHLYIGDVGDNFGRHKSRTIYKIVEPDPTVERKSTVKVLEAMHFRYKDQRPDCEALFFHKGRPYIITKHFLGWATLFRVGDPIGGVCPLEAICKLPATAVTAADISADGKRLAVLGYGYLAVFDVGEDLADLAKTVPKRVTFPAKYQTEACAFDGDDVLITAESREIWRVTAEDIEKQRVLSSED